MDFHKAAFLLLILTSLLVAPSHAAEGPTKQELITEVKNFQSALKGYFPKYTVLSQAIKRYLPRLDEIPDDADLSFLDGKTLLLPSNRALARAGLTNIPTNEADLAKLVDLGLINVLDGRYSASTLKDDTLFPTMLEGKKLRGHAVRKGPLRGATTAALGKDGSKQRTWSEIDEPTVFRNRWFTVHGVDRMQKP